MQPQNVKILRRHVKNMVDQSYTKVIEAVSINDQRLEIPADSQIALNAGPETITTMTLTMFVSTVEFEDIEVQGD